MSEQEHPALLPPFAKYDEGRVWLETLTMTAGSAAPDRFFRQVRESRKLSHALMSVFLGQADAAVVTRSGLDTSRQLPPPAEQGVDCSGRIP